MSVRQPHAFVPAHFLVENTFELRPAALFVAHGRLLDGVARIGQQVVEPTGLEAPVHSVEYVLIADPRRRENIALTFHYESEEQLVRWKALALAGRTLDLADGDPERPSGERAT